MKKIIFSTLLMLISSTLLAQKPDLSMIGFKPIVASEGVPHGAALFLEGKMNDLLTHEGIARSSGDFVIEIEVVELNKVLTPTAPPRYQYQLEVTFKAIDKSQGVVFNSISVNTSGMNTSENAAYMAAIRGINFRTRNFRNFVDTSKEKLYEYYTADDTTEPEQTTEPEPEVKTAPIIEPQYQN